MKTIKMLWPFALVAAIMVMAALSSCMSNKKINSAREIPCPTWGDYGYVGSK